MVRSYAAPLLGVSPRTAATSSRASFSVRRSAASTPPVSRPTSSSTFSLITFLLSAVLVKFGRTVALAGLAVHDVLDQVHRLLAGDDHPRGAAAALTAADLHAVLLGQKIQFLQEVLRLATEGLLAFLLALHRFPFPWVSSCRRGTDWRAAPYGAAGSRPRRSRWTAPSGEATVAPAKTGPACADDPWPARSSARPRTARPRFRSGTRSATRRSPRPRPE